MFDSIVVRNFKCYDRRLTTIPLAPLTILYGGNSAGKSSSIQSMLVLKQSWRANESLPGALVPEGRLVSLAVGSALYHKGGEGELQIGVLGEDQLVLFGFQDGPDSLNDTESRPLTTIVFASKRLTSLCGSDSTNQFVGFEFGVTWSDSEQQYEIFLNRAVAVTRVKTELNLVTVDAGACSLLVGSKSGAIFADGAWKPTLRTDGTLESLFSKVISEVATLLRRAWLHVDGIQYVGPLRVRGQRFYTVPARVKRYVGMDGSRAAAQLMHRKGLPLRTSEYLARLMPNGPREVVVERIGNTGVLCELSLKDPDRGLVAALPDVGCGVSQVLPVLVQLAIVAESVDVGTTVDRDTFGDVCFFEQPELHLHPGVQTRLGELLAETVAGFVRTQEAKAGGRIVRDGYGLNQHSFPAIIVETHSEHLVRAVQRYIANGRLDYRLVSFLAFHQPDQKSTTVVKIETSTSGGFRTTWPAGFFDDFPAL